ncbi:MAG: hypothetical protein U1E65_01570 [Myxococcota bacterium]
MKIGSFVAALMTAWLGAACGGAGPNPAFGSARQGMTGVCPAECGACDGSDPDPACGGSGDGSGGLGDLGGGSGGRGGGGGGSTFDQCDRLGIACSKDCARKFPGDEYWKCVEEICTVLKNQCYCDIDSTQPFCKPGNNS